MLQSISWQAYWTCIVALSVVYYSVIYLVYFRNASNVLSSRNFPAGKNNSGAHLKEGPKQGVRISQGSSFEAETSSEFAMPDENTEERLVYSLMDELKAFLEEARRTKWVKSELVHALGNILRKYPTLKDSSYKDSILGVLRTECEHYCSVHLDVEDMVRVCGGI